MTDKWSDFWREDLCDLATRLTADCEKLESELAAARADATSAMRLVADIRFALGDNGRRMQTELIEWCKTLAADARRLDRLELYHREMDDFDKKTHPGKTMWALFADEGAQGETRSIVDAAIPREEPEY